MPSQLQGDKETQPCLVPRRVRNQTHLVNAANEYRSDWHLIQFQQILFLSTWVIDENNPLFNSVMGKLISKNNYDIKQITLSAMMEVQAKCNKKKVLLWDAVFGMGFTSQAELLELTKAW